MSGLLLANLMIDDLTDVELEKHVQHCLRAMVARGMRPAAETTDPAPPPTPARCDEDDVA